MRFSKEIIQQFVSYIDLDDVKSFALLHPELVEVENAKEHKKIFTIGSFVTGIIIRQTQNLKFVILWFLDSY